MFGHCDRTPTDRRTDTDQQSPEFPVRLPGLQKRQIKNATPQNQRSKHVETALSQCALWSLDANGAALFDR